MQSFFYFSIKEMKKAFLVNFFWGLRKFHHDFFFKHALLGFFLMFYADFTRFYMKVFLIALLNFNTALSEKEILLCTHVWVKTAQ
jgi:hypothetical protein